MLSANRIIISRGLSPFPFSRIIPGLRIPNLDEIQIRFRNYIRRHIQDNEDALTEGEESNSNENPNFMKVKNINFRLYPFYINWKKLEANELDYYYIFNNFGFFGASIYSLFIEQIGVLPFEKIIYILSSFIPKYILGNNNKEETSEKMAKEYIAKLPNLDDLYQLIKKKIILMKEVPMLLIILKIYEIFFINQKNYEEIEKVLKSEYLLGTYLNNDEFNKIYKNHFKGKVNKIFIKIAEEKGREYAFPKTRERLFNHIKYIYNKFIKKNDN